MHAEFAADVAVIIPTTGSINLLGRALQSIVGQTVPPSEVLVVVDAPDRREEVRRYVGPFYDRLPNLRVLETGGARGPSYARNLAADESSAAYLAFLDDDDSFAPTKIELVGRHFGTADLIFHGLRWVVEGAGFEFVQRPGSASIPDILIENTIGPPTAVVVRRSVFQRAGGFRDDLPALEDYELWVRLVVNGATAVAMDVELARYIVRLRSGSRSSNTRGDQLAWEILHRIYAKQYGRLGKWQRAKHRQYIYRGRMHRNRNAGRCWRAAAWAGLAACACPGRRSFALMANMLTLPFLRFGSRELLHRLRLTSRRVLSAHRRTPGE